MINLDQRLLMAVDLINIMYPRQPYLVTALGGLHLGGVPDLNVLSCMSAIHLCAVSFKDVVVQP